MEKKLAEARALYEKNPKDADAIIWLVAARITSLFARRLRLHGGDKRHKRDARIPGTAANVHHDAPLRHGD